MLAANGWKGPAHAVEGPAGLLPSYLRGTGRKPDYEGMKRDLLSWKGWFLQVHILLGLDRAIPDALDPIYKREKLKAADVEKFIILSGRGWKVLQQERCTSSRPKRSSAHS